MKKSIFAFVSFIVIAFSTLAFSQQTQDINGCICHVDQNRQTLNIIPWDNDKKSLEVNKLQLFVYSDSTIIIGDNTLRVADLRTGKALKTINLEKIEADKNGQLSKLIGTSVEAKELSKLIGRKVLISWINKNGKRFCEKIKLSYNFPGESFSATTSLETGRSQVIMSNRCECK